MRTKADAGYICKPDTDYECATCVFLKPLGDMAPEDAETAASAGCAFFGPSDPISPANGGCNAYIHGDADDLDIPWIGTYTKLQLGYLENKNGFGCKRCEHLSMAKHDCTEVDKNSPGDTPGEINPMSCCDFWAKDKERGALTRKQLDKLVAAQDIKKMDFAAYEKQRGAR